MPTVEVVNGEVIVPRGRKTTTWYVRYNDAWILAAEHPNAVVERLDSGPGTVWEQRIEISLPEGTRLRRIDSAPADEERRDPLVHLTRDRSTPKRTTRRIELSVGPRGELVRSAGRSG